MNLSAIGSALSGIQAEARAVETVAANIAHMNDTIRPGDASTGARREFESQADLDKKAAEERAEAYVPAYLARSAQKYGGVRAEPVQKDPPHELSFKPDDPNADEEGLVARPSILIENEFAHMMLARRALQANIASLRTADSLTGTVLNAKI